ncbi:MAG TPA: terminase family protein, partial [Armatimonadota bacterium]|nr:terminase family protein [Armatimonadota bacterium]
MPSPKGFDPASFSTRLLEDLTPFQAEAPEAPKLSFREFVDAVRPRYQWYRHCVVLADALQKVVDGEITRLMVFMPPRHGKSELVSRLFSAYYLYRHPERWVGINSYSAELAYTLSRAAREHYTRSGAGLRGDASAVKHWETGGGGGLWAAGVGGPITGKGFHAGVIDDPLKNAEEAASDTILAKQKEWYNSTFYTREEPGGAIIVVQTRWNEGDLSGWLLAQEGEDEP